MAKQPSAYGGIRTSPTAAWFNQSVSSHALSLAPVAASSTEFPCKGGTSLLHPADQHGLDPKGYLQQGWKWLGLSQGFCRKSCQWWAARWGSCLVSEGFFCDRKAVKMPQYRALQAVL